MSQDKAKELAKRHGYKVRAVPHSQKHPNGYVKIISPDGSEHRAAGWSQALEWLRNAIYGKRK